MCNDCHLDWLVLFFIMWRIMCNYECMPQQNLFTGIYWCNLSKSKKLIKLLNFILSEWVVCFSGPGLSSRCRAVLQEGTLVMNSELWRCFSVGAALAQNCCRLGATTKARAGDIPRRHPQCWQSRSSWSHGWGCPSWLLSACDGCGCSPAVTQSSSALLFLKRFNMLSLV